MITISDTDYRLIKRVITVVRDTCSKSQDRKVVNAIRRANLLLRKFERNEKKITKDPHPQT